MDHATWSLPVGAQLIAMLLDGVGVLGRDDNPRTVAHRVFNDGSRHRRVGSVLAAVHSVKFVLGIFFFKCFILCHVVLWHCWQRIRQLGQQRRRRRRCRRGQRCVNVRIRRRRRRRCCGCDCRDNGRRYFVQLSLQSFQVVGGNKVLLDNGVPDGGCRQEVDAFQSWRLSLGKCPIKKTILKSYPTKKKVF